MKNYSIRKKRKKRAKMSQKAGSRSYKRSVLSIAKDIKKPFVVYFFNGYDCKTDYHDPYTYKNAELIGICYSNDQMVLNLALGIKIFFDSYFYEILDHIIRNLNEKYIVYLFGFSFGGAVVNLLYEKLINHYSKNSEKNERKKIIIVTYGSIYLSTKKNNTNIDIVITNYMDINDLFVSSRIRIIGFLNYNTKVPKYDESWKIKKTNLSINNRTEVDRNLYAYSEEVKGSNNVLWIRLCIDVNIPQFLDSNTDEERGKIHCTGYMKMMKNLFTPDGKLSEITEIIPRYDPVPEVEIDIEPNDYSKISTKTLP